MPFDFNVLDGPYLRDLLDQPRALADTVAALPAALGSLPSFDRIVLTGMGGSYHVLVPAHLELIAAGFTSLLEETSELIYSMPRLLEGSTLLVILSQSGSSVEVVRLAEIRRGKGATIAVTNTADSPLAAAADAAIVTRAGPENSVSCKTALVSAAAMAWLSALLRGADLVRTRRDLEQAVPAVAAYLEDWRDHVAALAGELEGMRDLFVLGRGSSLCAVGMGGLIIKEAAHFHSEGMGAAAFRHGPFEMLRPDIFALVFAGDHPARARSLVRDIRATGARAALAGPSADLPALRLPEVPPVARPILEMLLPQMISVALAGLAGRQPGRFERISKITTVE